MPQLNTEAMTRLRDLIARVPEDLLHMRALKETADCGTAYCALGWTMTDPWFVEHMGFGLDDVWWMLMLRKAARFFGISMPDAHRLFASAGGQRYSIGPHAISRAEVLWNIDEILAGRPARYYRARKPRGANKNVVPLPATA